MNKVFILKTVKAFEGCALSHTLLCYCYYFYYYKIVIHCVLYVLVYLCMCVFRKEYRSVGIWFVNSVFPPSFCRSIEKSSRTQRILSSMYKSYPILQDSFYSNQILREFCASLFKCSTCNFIPFCLVFFSSLFTLRICVPHFSLNFNLK